MKPIPKVCLDTFNQASPDRANRLLLAWLSDECSRKALFAQVTARSDGMLCFPSRDSAPRECEGLGLEQPRKDPVAGHKQVVLVTRRQKISEILNDPKTYSSRVYAELGGGSFMLALDPIGAAESVHKAQRQAFSKCFPENADTLYSLSHEAWRAAAVLGLRRPEFDLADLAEQVGLRYVQVLMGYPTRDYRLLERSLRAAYRALVHQVMERHFVSQPVLIPEARRAMAELLTRTSALIDAYAKDDQDELKGSEDLPRPPGMKPVLRRLAELDCGLNGEQRAILALGAAIGTVGNVQSAVCRIVAALFKPGSSGGPSPALKQARKLAREFVHPLAVPTPYQDRSPWRSLLADLLRADPPIPYLPRIQVDAQGTRGQEYLLALGGGIAEPGLHVGVDDPLVWGLSPDARHHCAGQTLAWPLIIETVRQVIALPGLDLALDPETARPKGLELRHGFRCEEFRLTHRLDRRRAQTSLNVAMRLKAPVKDSADRVREVIRAGAPRIERALRESHHVHFAWFELIEADTVLVLHTVYDGPFGAYLAHFADRAGDLFDVLFEHLEDPPPTPVSKFPDEFVAHLLRYDRPPAMGYFFTAYPSSEVARIVRQEVSGPEIAPARPGGAR